MIGINSRKGSWLRNAACELTGDSQVHDRLVRAADTAAQLRWRDTLPRLHGHSTKAWLLLVELAEAFDVLAQTEIIRELVVAGAPVEEVICQTCTLVANSTDRRRFEAAVRSWMTAWYVESYARREAMHVADEQEAIAELEACLELAGQPTRQQHQD